MPGGAVGMVNRITLPRQPAIKCAAWASLPWCPVLDVTQLRRELPSEGHVISKNKATG